MDPVNTISGKSLPTWIKVIRGLFLLDAVLWMAVGVVYVVRMLDSNTIPLLLGIVIATLMFVYAGMVLILRGGIIQWPRWSFYLSVPLFAITAVLSVTDQVGFFDWVSLGLNILIVLFLVLNYRYFLRGKPSP